MPGRTTTRCPSLLSSFHILPATPPSFVRVLVVPLRSLHSVTAPHYEHDAR